MVLALKAELDVTHVAAIKGNVMAYEYMMAKIPELREVSEMHMTVLAQFKRQHPRLEFPDLHKELFSNDSWTNDTAQGDPTLTEDTAREWPGALLCQGVY